MKKIFLTTGFKILIWIGIIAIGGWGYWQFSNGMIGGDASSDSALISDVGLSNNASSLSLPVVSDTNSSGDLVPAENGNDASEENSDTSGQNLVSPSNPVVDQSPSLPVSALSIENPTSTDEVSVSAPASAATVCSMANVNAAAPTREVIFNEIAWMGSLPMPGETNAKAGEREWIELKNISSGTVDFSGWQILDDAGNLKIVSSTNVQIPAGGFYLLVRDGASLFGSASETITADAGYSGTLSNAGDKLALFDANCNTEDFLDASAGWPGGNNTTKQTLERDGDGIGWHTSVSPGGTPREENSVPVAAALALASSTSNTTSTLSVGLLSSPTISSTQYPISVSLVGAGSGMVSSTPAGIICGFQCEANFAAGTKISFSEAAEPGSLFKGWIGACGGSTIAGVTVPQCSFTVSSSVAVVAEFDPIATEPSSTVVAAIGNGGSSDSGLGNVGTANNSGAPVNHLLIAAIQIAGVSSSNDFVKIFNPTGTAIDLTGWKLHKKSSTGTDYSLKTFIAGNSIAPGGYFEWANSENGFADSIGADASSTETLSPDNSVALFDANGNIVDQVAWGTGTDQYVEGSAYPTDPTAGQVLARQSVGGAMVDTDNNASDFAIQ